MSDSDVISARGEGQVIARGSVELTFRRILADHATLFAIFIILLIFLLALAAPWLAYVTGHSPTDQFRNIGLSASGIPTGPNADFWLGSDQLGRDVLVRLAYGARVSLLVGVAASLIASLVAVIVGVVAGYMGGKADAVISSVIDLIMSVPFMLCALALVSVLGPSLSLSIAVIVFFSWAPMARVIRAQVISISRQDFILASRAMGAGPISIMVTDILPNLSALIIVYTTMQIPTSIVFEATLSFLGMGIVPPTPSWGGMLADASSNSLYLVAWWMVFVPGTALLLTTLAFNILGDGLRDALDPKNTRLARRLCSNKAANA